MRAEALRQLHDLRWLEETERHRAELRQDAEANPLDHSLRELLRKLDEVIAHEWRRLNPAQRTAYLTGEHRACA
jgi:hypothetical protein